VIEGNNLTNYHPFNSNPRAPKVSLPTGTIDSQFHVLGPREKYPVRPGAAYEMPSATWQALKRMHDALGIRRGIIVQTTTYGADHAVVLDALDALGPNYKACANALVFESADDAYLEKLHSSGVRGARFSFRQELGAVLGKADFDRAVSRMKELGWYMKIQPEQLGIVASTSWFEHLTIPILIDHMGRPDLQLPPEQNPNVLKMCELLQRGNFWVMLSLGEKLSRTAAPYDDVIPFARKLIDAAPHRCVWGSDWPHPVSKTPPPNDADLVELMCRYVDTREELEQILVHNPSALFGFGSDNHTAST